MPKLSVFSVDKSLGGTFDKKKFIVNRRTCTINGQKYDNQDNIIYKSFRKGFTFEMKDNLGESLYICNDVIIYDNKQSKLTINVGNKEISIQSYYQQGYYQIIYTFKGFDHIAYYRHLQDKIPVIYRIPHEEIMQNNTGKLGFDILKF
jgi:hypothetical protein